MKCPKCKSKQNVVAVDEGAALVLTSGKLELIPGWICLECSFSWVTEESLEQFLEADDVLQ